MEKVCPLMSWLCKIFKKGQPKKQSYSYDPYDDEPEMTAQDLESDIFHEECGDR